MKHQQFKVGLFWVLLELLQDLVMKADSREDTTIGVLEARMTKIMKALGQLTT